tara:strand:- start:31677 stop:32606 length:930 start_codon:yes stop_codon:yes gene_type:complete
MIKTIDIIVPFFNEEDVFEKFVQSLDLVRKKIELDEALKLNYIFVDNGSSDTTFEKISEYENKNKNVTLIKLIRNFGIDGALKAGIDKAKGDAAILIHGDLQDNPEIIINLVNEWGNGFEHVIVRYSFQNRENLFRKLGSYFYYKWANYASSNLIIKGVSDFRLISRRVLDFITSIDESVYLLRGILIWPGFKYKIIDATKDKRLYGKSKINLPTIFKYFKLPISISTRVLFVIPIFSISIFVISAIFIIYTLIYFLVTGNLLIEIEPRLTLLIIINVFILLFLGIISSYLGVLIEEVKNRPIYLEDDI